MTDAKCQGQDGWNAAMTEYLHVMSEHQLCDFCKLKVASAVMCDVLESINRNQNKATVYRKYGDVVATMGATLNHMIGPD